jgi:magnesium transporter
LAAVHTRAWRGSDVVAADFPIEQVSDHLDHGDRFVWVDLCAPDADVLHRLARELGIHELAVEDALSEHQRPKLDRYPTHSFISCHALRWAGDHSGRITGTEIDCVVGPRWLVTVRHDDEFPVEPMLERWEQSAHLLACGVKFLLYGVLDLVVDGYFDAVSRFDDYYDDVSEGLFADEPLDPRQQRHWFETRRSLVRFHRLVTPMREVVSGVMRRDEHALEEPLYPYFQDLYDHVLRIVESTDAVRDLMATIVETNLSLRDYRQNIIMKKVTSWAAIIAVPTLITGYYGMNVPYPGFARHWGVWASTLLMVVAAGALYAMFRRKEWI